MARWENAYDAQLDAYKAYSSARGHELAAGYANNTLEDLPPEWAQQHSLFDGSFPDRLEAALFNAEPVYVDPDMMTVFDAAWPGFQPEALVPTDLCTPSGFMFLPRPVAIEDVHGKTTTYRAVMWEPVEVRRKSADPRMPGDEEPHGGVVVYLFHAIEDHDDYTVPNARKFGAPPYVISHVMPWIFNDTADAKAVESQDKRSVYRPVQCLWRLMMQTLAVHTEQRPGGQFRKRWERANMPEKKVTVVRLRRTYEDKDRNGEPGSVEWKSRWIVGGHWRAQWYASIQMHRQIWISPYIKGSPDLPLVIKKTRVFEFVR